MNIKRLITLIKLKRKIKDYSQFFLLQNQKLNTCEYMESIPQKITSIYDEMHNIPKYNSYIEEYDLYELNSKKHNQLLDNLYYRIKSFSLDEIVSNPQDFDFNNIVNNYDESYNDICLLTKIDKKLKKFKEDYLEYKNNYKNIINQYELLQELNELFNNLPDEYLDEVFMSSLKEKIESIKIFFSKQEKKYYGLNIPNLKTTIDNHNENFIEKEIHKIIFDDINGKSLDLEQRRSIVCNPQSNLTVAGAGSGKTLTICGKVKYLLEYMKVDKNDILLLSYSNKSARDLEKKVNQIASDMNVYTFHALGLEILTKSTGKRFTVDDSFKAVIERYFREHLNENSEMLQSILTYYGLFLSNYEFEKQYTSKGDLYEDLKKSDFVTLKNQLQGYNTASNKLETLKKELVKSFEELAIANFLFISGIDYEYESTYKEEDTASFERRQYTPDFYFPKYNLYYEHYGIDKDGRASQYQKEEALEYLKGIIWKRDLHNKNNTKCIETYSYEFKDGTIFENLEKRLKEQGVTFSPLSKKEIYEAINSIYEGQSFKSFINLVRTFISLYKSQYPDETYFEKLKSVKLYNMYEQIRGSLFLDICADIYKYYIKHLEKENKIDFDDMILKSMFALSNIENYKFKYIIVDEFQDISQSRMRFLKKLIEHGNSKLYAVGDDWQAIYRFSGCDINIFLKFKEYFIDSKYCFITSTHRNSQELQNIAEKFITANPEQYKKNVKSNKHLINPVKIMYFDDNKYFSFIKILEDIANKNSCANVLLLGRNNKDVEIIESNRFYREKRDSDRYISIDFPNLNIRYMTVHASKGLEEDYVIIINADDNKYGFPNKIEDDILLNLVLSSRSRFEFAEERRLWYVALTRTRLYTYILSSINSPSIFVKEIEEGLEVMDSPALISDFKPICCPRCKTGRLVIRERKDDYKKFFGCSNYPYCNYTNNDLKQVNTNHRCKVCGDFMTFRRGKSGPFWGCKNYPRCTYTEDYIHPNQNQSKNLNHYLRYTKILK